MNAIEVIGLLLAVALVIYLFVALLDPERFQ
jgi:K+-transporting ATPase KdpF subunit